MAPDVVDDPVALPLVDPVVVPVLEDPVIVEEVIEAVPVEEALLPVPVVEAEPCRAVSSCMSCSKKKMDRPCDPRRSRLSSSGWQRCSMIPG